MNKACLRWALRGAMFLADRFDARCFSVVMQMGKAVREGKLP